MSSALLCKFCRQQLPISIFNTGTAAPCTKCGASSYVRAFPALLKTTEPGTDGELIVADEAACFYHLERRADTPCSHCGRFLCTFCEINWNDQTYCAPCLEDGKKSGRMKELITKRMLYDNVAMSLAVLPFLIFYFTLITAPITIFLSIYFWKRPGSLVGRTKVRFVIAIIIALVEIGGWVALITFFVVNARRT